MKWGLDSCCCWWSWFGCYPIRKVCGSRDFRHCRGWGRLGFTSSLILLWLSHFDSLRGLCRWQKSIVDSCYFSNMIVGWIEHTSVVSGEACVFAWFGCEVHYQQPQWRQVWNRHEDLPGARRCWGSGCSLEQPQPRWLHLTFPFLLEEWWSIYWDWQKRHLDSPAWSWVGEFDEWQDVCMLIWLYIMNMIVYVKCVCILLCYVLSYVPAVCMSCVCQPRQMWEARKDVMYEKIAADTMMEKESWRCRIWLDPSES